ncbi:IS3 family transposase [Cryobacterium cryoconiti]|uniref:IS3 family transposase n=1 Tax=Cryobacterium cryoconiti TaxID=1259239 RepID=UPI001F545B41|nr:IS3 family transposase [Cryobacterium cryoconiti]
MKADLPVSYLCHKLNVSRSGFYEWLDREPSGTERRNDELTGQVMTAFSASSGAAGYRKVTAALARQNTFVDRKTVAAIMRGLGLISPAAERAFKVANRRSLRTADPVDLLKRDFRSLTPGAIMVGDITYVHTQQGWLFVATVIDLASRAVLGYATGAKMTTQLITRAMNMAIETGHVKPGAIFHSDHGVQYRSKRFTRYCGKHGILRSMGARMQCWDNAAAESFFSKLKSERLNWRTFTTRRAARAEVISYIHHFNTARLHQTLNYATPHERLAELILAA